MFLKEIDFIIFPETRQSDNVRRESLVLKVTEQNEIAKQIKFGQYKYALNTFRSISNCFKIKMKSFLVIVILVASISLASACPNIKNPVCGRRGRTNTCQTFRNPCTFMLFNNGFRQKVSMTNCKEEVGAVVTCLNQTSITTSTTPKPWVCGTICTPFATAEICTYKINVQPEVCRKFRNECELNNYKCTTNPSLYASANSTRCASLTNYNDGTCV